MKKRDYSIIVLSPASFCVSSATFGRWRIFLDLDYNLLAQLFGFEEILAVFGDFFDEILPVHSTLRPKTIVEKVLIDFICRSFDLFHVVKDWFDLFVRCGDSSS